MNGFLSNNSTRYQRLDQFDNGPPNSVFDDHDVNYFQMQQRKIEEQDKQLDKIGGSIKVLKDMSNHISAELDNQSVILDDFSRDLDKTESKMDIVSKKMAKTLRMSTDRRQWMAIAVLSVIILILFILFFI